MSHHNNLISEKHKRYIIEVSYNNKEYYTLWGADLTTFNEEDKVLINEKNQFLLFSSIKGLLDYLKTSKNLFDERSTINWLKEIIDPVEPHSFINIDVLNLKEFDTGNKDTFTAIIDAKNFVSDFGFQTSNKQIEDILLSKDAQDFYDAYMDNYIWEGPIKPIDKGLVQRVIPLYNKLFNEVSKKTCAY